MTLFQHNLPLLTKLLYGKQSLISALLSVGTGANRLATSTKCLVHLGLLLPVHHSLFSWMSGDTDSTTTALITTHGSLPTKHALTLETISVMGAVECTSNPTRLPSKNRFNLKRPTAFQAKLVEKRTLILREDSDDTASVSGDSTQPTLIFDIKRGRSAGGCGPRFCPEGISRSQKFAA